MVAASSIFPTPPSPSSSSGLPSLTAGWVGSQDLQKRCPEPYPSPSPAFCPYSLPCTPFDRAWGTDTGGLIPRELLLTGHPSDRHLTAYYAVAPSILDALIDLWLQTPPALPIDRYTFLDLGAGKGRALMTAALHPFLDALGIELNPSLALLCKRNLKFFCDSAPILTNPSVHEGDVLEAPLPTGPILAFMFHPFEAPLLRRVLKRLAATDAPVDILYVNAEHLPTLEDDGHFERLFAGQVPMSSVDHLADLAEIANQTEYGSTGDEFCAIYRKR